MTLLMTKASMRIVKQFSINTCISLITYAGIRK